MRPSYSHPAAAPQATPLDGSRPDRRRLTAALLLALGLAPAAHGQQRPAQNFFRADAAARAAAAPLAATRTRTQALSLDEPGLRAALATAPPEGRPGAAPLVLMLPQPDGTSARFTLREAPIMAPALAARYPQIKTYAGVGLDDATATVRLDLTPQGFHAQVLSSAGPGFLIDPVRATDTRHYRSYYRKDGRTAVSKMARCGVVTTPAEAQASAARVAAWRMGGGAARATGTQLRSYRFTLSCTPEFAVTCGNTKAGVQAVEATFMNRMNGIFERELAVRLILVAKNDQLIFLSGTGTQPPVPYSDKDGYALPRQNQQNVDRLIGDTNYDLGLVLGHESIGGGALLGDLCQSGIKATNFIGSPVPSAYQLIRYSAHELGHASGALHTMNTDDPNRTADAAWEPGSGVTIMSYCGLFGPSNDAQSEAEPIFHTGSFEEIQAAMSARNCGTSTATGNTAPVVTAPASGKTLPANTPFKLTATATDANNDPLTYSWEELDLGPAGNLTMPQVTGETPPLFRSWLPVANGTRYFPRLAELVNNTVAPGERLPTVARTFKFRCTARDSHTGLVGVVGGVDYSALVTLSVSTAAGPFVVTAPNVAGLGWVGGSTQTVRWDVANTTAAPVSCAKVNLRLSLDGGLSYPTVLATGVANSGTASVVVPNAPTATARVMVEAADNYFFDISNANFTITPSPAPTITSFTPTSGPVGTLVTLTGTGWSGATAVRFNGTAAASFTVASATSITATVAAGTSSGVITVSTPAGTAGSATPFTVLIPPTVTALSPASGPVGTGVTVTGTGLSGATGLTLNGVSVTGFVGISATSMSFVVPAGARTGAVVVSTTGGASNGTQRFTVTTVSATAPATATLFSVWPNPVGTKGTLHVRLAGPASAARATLRNALGQLVRSLAFAGRTTELPTAGLASGLYLLSVQADGQAPTVRRVVVE